MLSMNAVPEARRWYVPLSKSLRKSRDYSVSARFSQAGSLLFKTQVHSALFWMHYWGPQARMLLQGRFPWKRHRILCPKRFQCGGQQGSNFICLNDDQQGKHSARKPPKLIILLICKTSAEMRKLLSSQAEKLTSYIIIIIIIIIRCYLSLSNYGRQLSP